MLDVDPHGPATVADGKVDEEAETVQPQKQQSGLPEARHIPGWQDVIQDMAHNHGKPCFQSGCKDRADHDHGKEPGIRAIAGKEAPDHPRLPVSAMASGTRIR